jgi:chemotaxis protein methyltransferase CheR
MAAALTDQEFGLFRRFIYDTAGISLSDAKKALVAGRLAKRVEQRGLASYRDYFRLLESGTQPDELQTAIDLLTTNETYFFREPKHFDRLRQLALAGSRGNGLFRVWSAACSTGEEPYSIAMVLADCLAGRSWELIASDISERVLAKARTGHYPLQRTTNIPPDYLRRFCLRGTGSQEGTLLVQRQLRQAVRFLQVNLNGRLPELGRFDIIFLRNVLIYFDAATKRQVVNRLLAALAPGGHLLIGHSESLNGIVEGVESIAPSVYRRPVP